MELQCWVVSHSAHSFFALHTQISAITAIYYIKIWISPSFVASSAFETQLSCKPLFLIILLILQRLFVQTTTFPSQKQGKEDLLPGAAQFWKLNFGSSLICSSSAFWGQASWQMCTWSLKISHPLLLGGTIPFFNQKTLITTRKTVTFSPDPGVDLLTATAISEMF